MTNIQAIKVMFAELTMNLQYNHHKDVKKAYQAAHLLNQVHPTEEHEQNALFFEDLDRLNDACKTVDER